MATQRDLAKHLCLSTRRIRDLLKAGILPSGGAGASYDLDACREAYINYLRGLAAGRIRGETEGTEPSGPPDYSELLIMEKHRALKLENDVKGGEFAPVSLISESLFKVGKIIIAHLDNIPLLLKRNWPEMTGDQVTLVRRVIAECRNAVADMHSDDDPDKIRLTE